MQRILVALDDDPQLAVQACSFAVELAARTGEELIVLEVHNPRRRNSHTPAAVEELIRQARARGVSVESYSVRGEYVSVVSQFAHHHKVGRVVVAQPAGLGVLRGAVQHRVRMLQERLACPLVVVRPRPSA